MNKEKLFNKAVFYLKIYGNEFTAWANCCKKCKYEIRNSIQCQKAKIWIRYDQIKKTYQLMNETDSQTRQFGHGGRNGCILWLDK